MFIFHHSCYDRLKEDEVFRKKWGVLNAEFKNNRGIFSAQYYTVFTLRRVIYALSQIFLNHVPNMQNSINIISTFMQLLFIIVYKPFNEKITMIQVVLEEASMILIMVLLFFFINEASLQKLIIVEAIIVFSLFAMLCINAILSLIFIISKVKEFLRKINRNKIVDTIEIKKNVHRVHPQKKLIVETYANNQTYENNT